MSTSSSAVSRRPSFAARWAAMSDSTRVAVGLAGALGCVPLVILLANSGPAFQAFSSWLESLVRQGLSPANAIRGYLVLQYGVVLAVGLAHMQRTRLARLQRRTKTAGKPPVNTVPQWALGVTMAGALACSVLVNMGDCVKDPSRVPVTDVWVYGIVGPLVALGIAMGTVIFAAGVRVCEENLVRAMNTIPTFLPLVIYCTAVNLGLYVGLWVLTLVLLSLEKDALPADYPDHFESAAPTAAGA